MELLKCDFTTNDYLQSGIVEVIERCNCITVTNTGADIVIIDGQVLNPGTPGTSLGDTITYALNAGEIFHRKRLQVVFQSAGGPKVTIIQKYYLQ